MVQYPYTKKKNLYFHSLFLFTGEGKAALKISQIFEKWKKAVPFTQVYILKHLGKVNGTDKLKPVVLFL
jgi:hypothetical protein